MVKLLSILKETLQEAQLNIRGVKNREKRQDTIIEKIWKQSPFKLKSGEEVALSTIVINGTEYHADNPDDRPKALAAIKNASLEKISFKKQEGDKEVPVRLGAIEKTEELGGMEPGSTLKAETAARQNLEDQLKQLGPIDIKVGTKVYEGVHKVQATKGNRKSDFELVGTDKTIYISHKKGSDATAFQNYGGLSKDKDNKDVKGFIAGVTTDIQNLPNGVITKGISFKAPVDDTGVALRAVYGQEYGKGGFGVDNVQVVCQGDTLQLVPGDDGIYTIKCNHTLNNGTMPSGDYTPYYYAKYAPDRDSFGIKNTRIGVYPKAYKSLAKSVVKKVAED